MNKNHPVISLAATQEQKNAVKEAADNLNLQMSTFIRLAINNYSSKKIFKI